MSDTAAVEAPVQAQDAPVESEAPQESPQTPEPAAQEAATPEPTEGAQEAQQDADKSMTPFERAKARMKAQRDARRQQRDQQAKDPKDQQDPADQPEGSSGDRGDGRNQKGQFVPKPKQDQEAQDTAASESTDAPSSDASKAPEGVVRIPLPEGHPLRARGMEQVDVPEGHEREYRAILNQWTTRSQVSELEDEVVRLRAQLEARQKSPPPNPLDDPTYQRLLDDIDRKYKPEMAQEIKDALRAKWEQGAQPDTAAIEATVAINRQAREFQTEVQSRAAAQYPMWAEQGELGPRMQQHIVAYGDWLDSENQRRFEAKQPPLRPDPGQFFEWVNQTYLKDPRVQAQVRQARTRQQQEALEKARQEERERLRKEEEAKLAEQRQRHRGRPPGVPVAGPRGARAQDAAPEVDLKALGPAGIRKHAKSIARGISRR